MDVFLLGQKEARLWVWCNDGHHVSGIFLGKNLPTSTRVFRCELIVEYVRAHEQKCGKPDHPHPIRNGFNHFHPTHSIGMFLVRPGFTT